MRGRECIVWFTLHAIKVAAAGEAPSRVIPDKASKRNFGTELRNATLRGSSILPLRSRARSFADRRNFDTKLMDETLALRLGSRVSKLRWQAKLRYATSRRNFDDCNLDHV
jgi:hypothetical protein